LANKLKMQKKSEFLIKKYHHSSNKNLLILNDAKYKPIPYILVFIAIFIKTNILLSSTVNICDAKKHA
jgi:hypothetical protein